MVYKQLLRGRGIELNRLHPSIVKYSLWLLCLITPTVIAGLLINVHLDVSLEDYYPENSWTFNDSFYYWRQAYTFYAVDFDGGYYTVNEEPATASFTRFYAWGPGYPFVYGTIAKVIGWHHHTPIVINLMLLTMAIGVFLFGVPLNTKQLIAFALMLILFLPIHFFSATSLQENLVHSLVIVLSVVIVSVFSRRHSEAWYHYIIPIGIVMLIGIFRPTWAMILCIIMVVPISRDRIPMILFGLVVSIVIVAIVFVFSRNTYAPYGYWDTVLAFENLGDFINARLYHIVVNFQKWFDESLLVIGQRYLVLALIVLSGWKLIRGLFKRGNSANQEQDFIMLSDLEALFHLFNLGFIFVFNYAFNDAGSYRSYRSFAQHLLLTVLILIVYNRYRLLVLVSIVHILLIPSFLSEYTMWGEQFISEAPINELFYEQATTHLTYDSETDNPWCNTVVFNIGSRATFPIELIDIDAGLGLTFIARQDMDLKQLKSKYYFANRPDIVNELEDNQQFTLLFSTTNEHVYVNSSSGCES